MAAPRERTETDESGRVWKITTLPPDRRLQPKATRDRALFQSLSSAEKHRLIASRVKKSKRKRRRKRGSDGG